jgi:RHS repeat-associated protein
VVVGRTWHVYKTLDGGKVEIVEKASSQTAAFGDAGNERITTVYYSAANGWASQGLVKSVENSKTGAKTSYVYETGTFTDNPNSPGSSQFSAGAGDSFRKIITEGTIASPAGVANKTKRHVSIRDSIGNDVMEEEYVYNGTDYERIYWKHFVFNSLGKIERMTDSSGNVQDTAWASCGCRKEYEKDSTGVESYYSYDSMGRRVQTAKVPASGTNMLYTIAGYDKFGRQNVSLMEASGQSLMISSNVFDAVGRVLTSKNQQGLETSYSYPNKGRDSVVVYPGDVTNSTESYLDGRTKVTKQNGVIKSWHDYGVNADGSTWTKIYTGPAGTNSPMWQKSTADLAGRTIREERPGYSGTIITNESFYNTKGQLVKTTTTGQLPMLYEYTELGEQYRSTLDVNSNGVINLAGPDRVSESDRFYEKDASGNWWSVLINKVYAKDSSSDIFTNSIQRSLVLAADPSYASYQSYSVSRDSLGNETVAKTIIDRANKKVTQVVDYPDSTNDAVSIAINGLATESTSKTGVKTTYQQDGFGRQVAAVQVSDAGTRTVGSFTHFNSKGQVDYTEDAASNRTSFAYDEATGRRISVTDSLTNTTYTSYSSDGQVIGTWGATYPVLYEQDAYDRMSAMYTYRGTNSITSYSEMLGLKSQMDKTAWLYHEPTGLLTNKLYSDGKGTRYTYTPDGRLLTRTWARGITTTYSYSLCCGGSLTGIDYSDNTPDVAFSYNRIGQQVTITDGTGIRQFTYDDQLRLAAETNVMGQITRTYDSLGRSSGFFVGPDLASAPLSVSYAFSDLGRFSSVVWSNSAVGAESHSAIYSYLPGTDHLSGYQVFTGGTTYVSSVLRSYEGNRNLITEILNSTSSNVISRYQYSNDAIGRRTQRVDNGSLTNLFSYNIKSELVAAMMAAHTFSWELDNIGNRISTTTDGEQKRFTANNLNQYTAITNGGARTLSYDFDGNLTNDSVFTYSYNGENRLILTEPLNLTNGSERVRNAYDYMGRRWMKAVDAWDGSSWQPCSTNLFLYDGYSVISEICNVQSVITTNLYVRGLDLSGTLQGAGGTGGLLAMISGANTWYYFGDANGNVTELVTADGTLAAHYKWDAYGNRLNTPAANEPENSYGFSSQYYDKQTRIYMYIFRPYSPEDERWTSRDPIGESGGLLLYGYCGNDGIMRFDKHGLVGSGVNTNPWTGEPTIPSGKDSTSAIDWALRKLFNKYPDKEIIENWITQGGDMTLDIEALYPSAIPFSEFDDSAAYIGYVCCMKESIGFDMQDQVKTGVGTIRGITLNLAGTISSDGKTWVAQATATAPLGDDFDFNKLIGGRGIRDDLITLIGKGIEIVKNRKPFHITFDGSASYFASGKCPK